jgi:hypothetical protein
MTAIARMPDSAIGDGVANDGPALQSMFNACPVGGLCIIPDGVFLTNQPLHVPRPMQVWCSPGAHIKGNFSNTDPVVWVYWHTPDGTSDLYVAMISQFWQGGTISRLNRNGACLRVSTQWAGAVHDVRFERGSPHLWLDAPDTVGGWYKGGPTSPEFGLIARAVNCRGYDGGQYGCRVGQGPTYPGSGQTNGYHIDHCYFEGNGAAGSRGIWCANGGGILLIGTTFNNYESGLVQSNGAKVVVGMGMKFLGISGQLISGTGSDTGVYIHPRGWQTGRGALVAGARDPQGVYL